MLPKAASLNLGERHTQAIFSGFVASYGAQAAIQTRVINRSKRGRSRS